MYESYFCLLFDFMVLSSLNTPGTHVK